MPQLREGRRPKFRLDGKIGEHIRRACAHDLMAHGVEDREVKALKEHGFDDYLKKPFSAEDLQARVKALFELPPNKSAQPKHTRTF